MRSIYNYSRSDSELPAALSGLIHLFPLTYSPDINERYFYSRFVKKIAWGNKMKNSGGKFRQLNKIEVKKGVFFNAPMTNEQISF